MSAEQKQLYVVPVEQMRSFVANCMQAIGADSEQALQLADLLVTADLRGHYSHGVNRLRIYMEDVVSGNCKPNGQPHVLKQKGGTAWVDGDNALGVVVGNYCTDLAIKLAQEHGVGWVVAKGSNHFGIAGYYPLRMAEQGFVGMAFTNTSPLMFPNRSAQVGLGTNPISVVAPAERPGDSFALDMATTTVALGKVELAQRKGEKIPLQWGANSSGKVTDNPDEVVDGGALLPLGGAEETGGYKGTGLAMMVELFCGILGGATFGKNIRTWRETSRVADLGQCFVALDPECFAPNFIARIQIFLDETRDLEQSDHEKPILVAGDPERHNIKRCEKAGGLIYGKAQLQHLEEIGQHNGVTPFTYSPLGDS
ncbi:malate/L-lactate dehydrogenase domain-containing protein [Ditylenchus destructor]|uniref:Malate/L-lactate dehydrogenase domain-containing protein n=1 Tax=Ditylenchus destructor TaxID=166010 RepID=A0AAD4NLS0_9BILA|nr:malate/L-lactate dehydrogenase domain-containing protein [Ditylenchus destructor]